ncbi:MAG: DNA primase, partial [Cytophagales bacterium]|nr:DNA primase [Cytophagales bacterium]
KTVLLPDKEDPDSYARKVGSTAFQDYLKTHVQDFITFKASILIREVENDPIKKAEAIQEIVESIAVVPDSIKRTVFTKECSKLLDIEEGVLIAEQNKLILQKSQESEKRRKARPTAAIVSLASEVDASQRPTLADSIAVYEKESIRMLLSYGTTELEGGKLFYEYLLRELEEVSFRTPECKEIWEQFKAQLSQGKVVDAAYFIQTCSEAIKKFVIDLIAEPYEISDQWEERYQIYVTKEDAMLHQAAFKNILRLKLRLIQQLIEDNRAALKNNTALEEEKLLKVHEVLKKSEMEIAKQLSIVVTS